VDSNELTPPWAAEHAVEELMLFEQCFCDLLLQLAEALAYLHDNLCSHNDLHEGNVLVSMNKLGDLLHARVGICDWGEASTTRETRSFAISGTRDYVPPEHVLPVVKGSKHCDRTSRVRGATCSSTTDVYSFGYLMKLVCNNRSSKVPSKWVKVADQCLRDEKGYRPSMKSVVAQLQASLYAK
jgi:serine/threonine protein kinase